MYMGVTKVKVRKKKSFLLGKYLFLKHCSFVHFSDLYIYLVNLIKTISMERETFEQNIIWEYKKTAIMHSCFGLWMMKERGKNCIYGEKYENLMTECQCHLTIYRLSMHQPLTGEVNNYILMHFSWIFKTRSTHKICLTWHDAVVIHIVAFRILPIK